MKTNPAISSMTAILVFAAANAAHAQNTIVKPEESREILVNPGMGFTTFNRFNEDHHSGLGADLDLESMLTPEGDLAYCGYPPSSIAYFRWYWDVIEPAEGEYAWEIIDGALKKARENGQRLAFRVMPQNGAPKAPAWYREMARGFAFNNGAGWMPDYGDPLYRRHFGRLIAALGERYNGHPDIDHVDIGALGRWGEWHTSQTGHPMPSMDIQKHFVDLYAESFPDTRLCMLIGGGEALRRAVELGAGWRADCLGDVGGFSENWNHMEDMYPLAVSKAGAWDVWKTAQVVFETCWTIEHWVENGWDVEGIADRALFYHTSVLNNKSVDVPREAWPAVNRLLRGMGYRFVLRRVFLDDRIAAGESVPMETLWENTGVSPCYDRYHLAYRLVNGETVFTHESEADIRTWTPGYHAVDEAFAIPADAPGGTYTLQTALVEPGTLDPAVKLAIKGREPDGWHTVCAVRIGARNE